MLIVDNGTGFLLLDTVSGVKKFDAPRNEEQFIKEQLIKMIIQLDLDKLKEFGLVESVPSEEMGDDYYFRIGGRYLETEGADEEG